MGSHINTFLFLLLFLPLSAQQMEEDITVQYMKANVLFQSGRFDEAVRMYNRILSQDEHYLMALLMRAKAKYELGAYKGTKIDALSFIEKGGVNKDIIHLMARNEFKLANFQAANNYITTALELDEYDGELYYMAGEISLSVEQKNDACERFAKGATLGHQKSIDRLATECEGRVLSMMEQRTNYQEDSDRVPSRQSLEDTVMSQTGIDTLGTSISAEDESQIPEEVQLPPADTRASQDIVVDSKLTLQVTNGLGERNIENTPNIFMLSTEDGHVVIDICVNADGKVISSSFNRSQSSLYRSSLTSLALRKSREFIFMPSLRNEQCGSIIYYVKS